MIIIWNLHSMETVWYSQLPIVVSLLVVKKCIEKHKSGRFEYQTYRFLLFFTFLPVPANLKSHSLAMHLHSG